VLFVTASAAKGRAARQVRVPKPIVIIDHHPFAIADAAYLKAGGGLVAQPLSSIGISGDASGGHPTRVRVASSGGSEKTSILLERARTLARRMREPEPVTLSGSATGTLNCYEFTATTAEFFYRRLGRTRVKVVDTPHFAFAYALHRDRGDELTAAEHYFRDFLRARRPGASGRERDDDVNAFRASFEFYLRRGDKRRPVLVRLPTAADAYVVRGLDAAAMAAAAGRRLYAAIWPPDLAFRTFERVEGFYGTGHQDRPYQSITLGTKEVVPGRRDDLKERLLMLPADVIAGRSILDLACNVGMSSLLARSMGATSCRGLELSDEMVSLATRFAMISSVYPEVSYRQFDLDQDELPGQQHFDTAFMFSIHDHLRNPARLRDIAARNVRRYVVFEGHPRGVARDYEAFFESGIFSRVSEVGRHAGPVDALQGARGQKLADVAPAAEPEDPVAALDGRRTNAIAELDDFEGTRDEAVERRNRALANLDVWLERFEREATARGATVLWAETPRRRRGWSSRSRSATRCARSPSRSRWCPRRWRSTATSRPPASRSSRPTSASTSCRSTTTSRRRTSSRRWCTSQGRGVRPVRARARTPRLTDIPQMTREAREFLRPHFLSADMGVSGGNFLIAETGSVAMFTNEGNEGMCTVLPPKVHVVVTGIEKVLPTLEDLATCARCCRARPPASRSPTTSRS
jgi:hypothetical protein